MKRIIIIQHEPLCPNIEKKYCLKELRKADFDIEYWDISQIIYPGLKVADELSTDYLKKLYTFDELKELWGNLSSDNCIVIAEFFFDNKNKNIWKLICNSGIPLVKIERYANTNIKGSLYQKIISHINPISAIKYVKNLFFKVQTIFLNIYQYDYLLSSGTYGTCNYRINHPDYDDYLLHKNDPPVLSYPYVCFIDTGFGIHPDGIHYFNFNENNKLWQSKLSAFFSKVEEKYGIPVVIAVHPKIAYPEDAFGGRKKIKYKTLNLVKNAEFVLQDISNSLSFSVIANKKLALISTNDFWRVFKFHLTNMSKKIDVPIFNIDKDPFPDFVPVTIDESKRLAYMTEFLCTEETKDKLTSSILIDFLKKL